MPGMASILDMKGRVTALKNNLDNNIWVREIITANEAYIVNLNAEIQLEEQGINSVGVDIMDYRPYTPLTIEIKKQKGQPTNRVTLHDEGDFAASIYLDIGDNQFQIRASDWKTESLIIKYGRQILGLTHENLYSLIWEYIYPDLLDRARNTLAGRDSAAGKIK